MSSVFEAQLALCDAQRRARRFLTLRSCLLSAASLLAVMLLGVALLGTVLAGTVSYVYDALGRLIAVYDPSGNAAVYQYDGVGNLLSITNYSSGTFAGIGLSSGNGTSGSNITLYGTDFCSNPAVTFNGIAATVVSATATQIVVARCSRCWGPWLPTRSWSLR